MRYLDVVFAAFYVYAVSMTDNDNGVNINSMRHTYHHGDLRASLVSVGLEILKLRTADDLSLREVARSVGVSATAVYRHFPDKQALLHALCEEGRAMLAEAQRVAMAASGGGQKGFDATGLAYVHFALANPSLFRLMAKTQPPREGGTPAGNVAMQVLQSNVAAILPKSATARQRQARAVRAWSLVHGVAMLLLDGRIPHDEKLIADVIREPKA